MASIAQRVETDSVKSGICAVKGKKAEDFYLPPYFFADQPIFFYFRISIFRVDVNSPAVNE